MKELKIYPVQNAKMPLLKLKYKDSLNIDLSFAVINNQGI